MVDSSVIVPYLRFGRYREFLLSSLQRGTMSLPGVVVCEIYAGATTREDRAAVEALRRALGDHVVTTAPGDWILAGRCLADYSRHWGRIRPRDHLADVLVAIAALRAESVLVSADLGQMGRWAWVLGRLGRRLVVRRVGT